MRQLPLVTILEREELGGASAFTDIFAHPLEERLSWPHGFPSCRPPTCRVSVWLGKAPKVLWIVLIQHLFHSGPTRLQDRFRRLWKFLARCSDKPICQTHRIVVGVFRSDRRWCATCWCYLCYLHIFLVNSDGRFPSKALGPFFVAGGSL